MQTEPETLFGPKMGNWMHKTHKNATNKLSNSAQSQQSTAFLIPHKRFQLISFARTNIQTIHNGIRLIFPNL